MNTRTANRNLRNNSRFELDVGALPQSIQFLLCLPIMFGILGQFLFSTETRTGGGLMLGISGGAVLMFFKVLGVLFASVAARGM
jgi:hypothetical protein